MTNQKLLNDQLKRAAKAILTAQTERENSWDEDKKRYKKTTSECYMRQFRKAEVDHKLIELLSLSLSWWNDIRAWANNTLKD